MHIISESASGQCSTDNVKLLLDHGADVNTQYYAKNGNIGNAKVIEMLLTHGADINALENIGWTPMHFASYKGHIEVVNTFCLLMELLSKSRLMMG